MRMIKTALILLLSSTIPATADIKIVKDCEGTKWDFGFHAEPYRITGTAVMTDNDLLLDVMNAQGESKQHNFKFIHEHYNPPMTGETDSGSVSYYVSENKKEENHRYVLAKKNSEGISFLVYEWFFLSKTMVFGCKTS